MADTVRIGVIGTGFGVHHVEVFRMIDGVEVTAVASAQTARAEAVASRHSIPVATDDYRQLLPHVDAVVIAAPPGLHAAMTHAAIEAGKHIFCEKPMAATAEEARGMLEAAEAAGIVHMLNFQQRFTPHFRHSAELVERGEIGNLLMADMRVTINPVDYLHLPLWSDSKTGWFADAAQGGGLLASSVGPHLIDLLLWHGGALRDVSTRTIVSRSSITLPDGSEVSGITAEDGFVLFGRYLSGALLTIRGVPVAYGGNEWSLELHGSDGSLHVDGSTVKIARQGDPAPQPVDTPAGETNLRIAIASAFVEAVRAGGPSPVPTFREGYESQVVLDASLLAARTGEWVEI